MTWISIAEANSLIYLYTDGYKVGLYVHKTRLIASISDIYLCLYRVSLKGSCDISNWLISQNTIASLYINLTINLSLYIFIYMYYEAMYRGKMNFILCILWGRK